MTQTLLNVASDFDVQLASSVSVGATTATLTSATDDDGNALPTGTYGLTIDAGNSSKEYITCTLTSTALTNVVSISRQGVSTTGFVRAHRRGAKVTLTDWATLSRINRLLNGTTDFDSGTPLKYDGVADMTGSTNKFATVKYVNDTAISGAPDASTTTKGIGKLSVAPVSPTNPIFVGDNDPRLQETNYVPNSYAASATGTDAYAITLNDAPSAYATGQIFYFKADVANTGTATLDVNSLGAKTILRSGGATLLTGDVLAGQLVQVEYNGTSFEMQSAPANTVNLVSGAYPAGDGSAITGTSSSLSDIPSGENITAGQPVYIDPTTSTVYKAHGWKEINTASFTAPTTVTNLKPAKLSTTQFLMLSDNGTTTLSVTLHTTSSGALLDTKTVTTAFDQTSLSTTTAPSATVCRLTDTTFVVIYAKTTDNFLYFRTGSVSGSTITMDTETAYPGTPDFCYCMDSLPGASDGKVVFSYIDSTGEGGAPDVTPKLSYLTVATNSITVTTTISGTTVSAAGFNTEPVWSVAAFTNGIAYGMFCFKNGNGVRGIKYNWINTNDSTTGANLQTPDLEAETGAGTSSGYSAFIPSFVGHNGKCYFGWGIYMGVTGGSTKIRTVIEATQVGSRILYQVTTAPSAGDTSTEALSMAGNEMGVLVFGFLNANNASISRGVIYIQKSNLYSFYNADILFTSSFALPTVQMWFSNQKDEVVLSSNTEYLKTWRLPTPMDGIALASVTSPTAPLIKQVQVTTSGLTANALYFLKDTYTTTGDMAFSGTIPVGQALSTTVMKVKPTQ